jgi:hypothetical protein
MACKTTKVKDEIWNKMKPHISPTVIVELDESMIEDEEEMEIYGGCLREGYPPEIAKTKTKEWMRILRCFKKQPL